MMYRTVCYVKTQLLIKILFPSITTLMVYFILEEVEHPVIRNQSDSYLFVQ